MAHPAFIMVALLLLAAATPLANGQALNAITVNGQICCTSAGNCNGGAAGISGVLVSLNCTTNLGGASVKVGQGVTGVNGAFNISIPNLLGTLGSLTSILGGSLPCAVIVNLPLSQAVCPILNTATGILAGVPTLVNTIVSPVLGAVGNLAVPLLVNVKLG